MVKGGDQGQLASWIELEGCFNFRDLGGYRTRDGGQMRTGRVYLDPEGEKLDGGLVRARKISYGEANRLFG